MDIAKELNKKGADTAKIARYAVKNPECIEQLIDGVTLPKGSIRFGYEKVLRLISEKRPELIYPYFNVFKKLSGCDNSFLKWGAIIIVFLYHQTDLIIDKIFEEYYAPITGQVMVTASNVIGGSVKIALAKPYLTQKITQEILKVEKAKFLYHGELSPECRNVAIGQAIDSFDNFYEQIENKDAVIKFVKRQLKNSRAKVAKKAEKFLKKHTGN